VTHIVATKGEHDIGIDDRPEVDTGDISGGRPELNTTVVKQ